MFPDINIINTDNDLAYSDNLTGKKIFLFDFENGEFILKDGKLVIASELEAIKIWINKIILTEKFKFKIYEKENEVEYGVSIMNLIGKKLPKQFVKSEIKRELNDVLITHPGIESISDWEIVEDGSKVNISFKVILINSNTLELEVNI